MKRLVAVAFAAAIALAGVATAGVADENRECDNNEDVTVVVDFGDLGGGVNVRCAAQGSDGIDSGFDALEHAQISYEQTGGFLCRIAGKPESTQCSSRPPSGPYWAYYYAKRGGDWKYSNYGAGSRKPPPGSVDGWAYSDSEGHASPPGYPVPGPIAQTTTTSQAPATTASHELVLDTREKRADSEPVDEITTTTEAVDALADDATTTSARLGNVDLSVEHGGGGTSVGFIASLGAVVALAAVAAVFLRRRA